MDHELSLETVRIRVRHAGRCYLLCEASEAANVAYQSALARLNEAGDKLPLGDRAGQLFELQSYLLSLCLYDTDENFIPRLDEHGNLDAASLVGVERVRALPARFVTRLHTELLRISDLDVKQDQAALEKEFTSLIGKLVDFADTPGEKTQWLDWMKSEVEALASRTVGQEEPAKNGRVATPATSA